MQSRYPTQATPVAKFVHIMKLDQIVGSAKFRECLLARIVPEQQPELRASLPLKRILPKIVELFNRVPVRVRTASTCDGGREKPEDVFYRLPRVESAVSGR